jgi:hypothetical protein
MASVLGWTAGASALPVILAVAGFVATDVAAQRGGGRPVGGESYGNNLSYPVIWAEGVTKVLRGTSGMTPIIDGAFWYWWGIDPVTETPLSAAADPDNIFFLDDGQPLTWGPAPPAGAIRAYLQKDEFNTWQATTVPATGRVLVDLIDWGDNLESVDWNINSQVRTEVVLIEDLSSPDPIALPGWEPATPITEYGMRHVSGWGINEVHGLAVPYVDGVLDPEEVTDNPGATVYSHCARLVIQRLMVDRGHDDLQYLIWDGENGWIEPPGYEPNLINPPIYDGRVWEGGDGPGYYSAEINVKGKIIYGYTWNVRKNNEGVGDYRITFSLESGTPNTLNTFFVDGVTQILQVVEEGGETDESDEGGARPVIDFGHNLTYLDMRIAGKTSGGGGGGKKNK